MKNKSFLLIWVFRDDNEYKYFETLDEMETFMNSLFENGDCPVIIGAMKVKNYTVKQVYTYKIVS